MNLFHPVWLLSLYPTQSMFYVQKGMVFNSKLKTNIFATGYKRRAKLVIFLEIYQGYFRRIKKRPENAIEAVPVS